MGALTGQRFLYMRLGEQRGAASMIAMNAHSLGVIILLLIALRCLLGDWTQAALMSGLGVASVWLLSRIFTFLGLPT